MLRLLIFEVAMGTVYTVGKSASRIWEALSLCGAQGRSKTHLLDVIEASMFPPPTPSVHLRHTNRAY